MTTEDKTEMRQMGNTDLNCHIALYQPDIAGNTGTILRLAACVGARVHIIEPAGFDITDRNLKRAGMDYLDMAALTRHLDWDAFCKWRETHNKRLVLLTTKTDQIYTDFEFSSRDVLLFGRESAGVPQKVHDLCDERLTIKMQEGARSLNLALSVAMIAGEVIRQIRG